MVEILERAEFYEFAAEVSVALGLHSRPCMELVDILGTYKNKVSVTKEINDSQRDSYANGKSVMGLMSLMAVSGTKVYFLFEKAPHKVEPSEILDIAKRLEERLKD